MILFLVGMICFDGEQYVAVSCNGACDIVRNGAKSWLISGGRKIVITSSTSIPGITFQCGALMQI